MKELVDLKKCQGWTEDGWTRVGESHELVDNGHGRNILRYKPSEASCSAVCHLHNRCFPKRTLTASGSGGKPEDAMKKARGLAQQYIINNCQIHIKWRQQQAELKRIADAKKADRLRIDQAKKAKKGPNPTKKDEPKTPPQKRWFFR